MTDEPNRWPTDLLDSAESIVKAIASDVSEYQEGPDHDEGFAADLQNALRRVGALLEEVGALTEPLERAAGRPPMTREEQVADIARRLREG